MGEYERPLDELAVCSERVDIVTSPPSRATLAEVLDRGIALRALFNTSGVSYREGNFKERLATLSRDEALDALANDGKLIKRPFVVGDGVALVGFDEARWREALAGRG